MLIAYKGAFTCTMCIDCVYECYIHAYRLCIWVICTGILIVYMGAKYKYIDWCYLDVF